MKILTLALVFLGIQLTYAQEFSVYRGPDKEIYRSISIDTANLSQGIICGADGNKIAAFHAAICSWVFNKEGVQTFFDKDDKQLAQIRYENNQANLYDNTGKLVHTFAFDPNSSLSPKSYRVALTKSDDIVMLDPQTHQIVDSYNFRVQDIATKISNADSFSSVGSFIRIVYDGKGNFNKTEALHSEFDADSSVAETPAPRKSSLKCVASYP